MHEQTVQNLFFIVMILIYKQTLEIVLAKGSNFLACLQTYVEGILNIQYTIYNIYKINHLISKVSGVKYSQIDSAQQPFIGQVV